jgi:hypothetical protein
VLHPVAAPPDMHGGGGGPELPVLQPRAAVGPVTQPVVALEPPKQFAPMVVIELFKRINSGCSYFSLSFMRFPFSSLDVSEFWEISRVY